MVVQPKRPRLPSFIPQFICTMDQEYPIIRGPKVSNAAIVVNRLELHFFYPYYTNGPLFPKEIQTRYLSSWEGFFPYHAYISLPKIFQPLPPQSPSPYILSLEWVSHHERTLSLGKWTLLYCIYLDGWGPFNILEINPLELALASKFVFGR